MNSAANLSSRPPLVCMIAYTDYVFDARIRREVGSELQRPPRGTNG
jgi:hypothetical protein